MCRNIWENTEKKGAMCNGRLHIMAEVFSLSSWNERGGEKWGKIKNEKQKKDGGKLQNKGSSCFFHGSQNEGLTLDHSPVHQIAL